MYRAAALRSGPPAMTYAVQPARQIVTEVDKAVLEQNVTQIVTKSLEKTVNETVRRELSWDSSDRIRLIEQIGSELYDRVVLERERRG